MTTQEISMTLSVASMVITIMAWSIAFWNLGRIEAISKKTAAMNRETEKMNEETRRILGSISDHRRNA